jgi:hypothetical protein
MKKISRNKGHSPVLDKALKKEDFPTFGRPTIPIFRLLEGRPRSAFFSWVAGFLGGILVFDDLKVEGLVEKRQLFLGKLRWKINDEGGSRRKARCEFD